MSLLIFETQNSGSSLHYGRSPYGKNLSTWAKADAWHRSSIFGQSFTTTIANNDFFRPIVVGDDVVIAKGLRTPMTTDVFKTHWVNFFHVPVCNQLPSVLWEPADGAGMLPLAFGGLGCHWSSSLLGLVVFIGERVLRFPRRGLSGRKLPLTDAPAPVVNCVRSNGVQLRGHNPDIERQASFRCGWPSPVVEGRLVQTLPIHPGNKSMEGLQGCWRFRREACGRWPSPCPSSGREG